MTLGPRRSTAWARISDWREIVWGDSRLAGSSTMPMGASGPSSSRSWAALCASRTTLPGSGSMPRRTRPGPRPPAAGRGCLAGRSRHRWPRCRGAPATCRPVAGAGTQGDDLGVQFRDQTDQPDRLRGEGSAEPGVGMDDVEGRRDAGDAHPGAVGGGPDGGDLGLVDVVGQGRAADGGEVPVGKGVAARATAVAGGLVHSLTSELVATAVVVASMRRTAASPSRTSGTGGPAPRMARANAST
jgi:hypothetical protein